MLLSPLQVKRFWTQHGPPGKEGWPQIVAAYGWSSAEAESQRKAMLARAGFTSLTLVTPVEGFTAVLKEMAILRNDLSAMLLADENPARVLIHNCRELSLKLGGEPYIVGLAASDRFKCSDWPSMPLEIMEQLRNTLADRAVEQHSPATQARRRSAPRPRITDHESRITFAPATALVSGPF